MTKISQAWATATLEARITAHVHAWQKARENGHPLAPETYPFVTISREFGCEAVPLATHLADLLNERCRPFFSWVAYDKEVLDKVSQELHLQRGVIEAIDGHRRGEMSELFDSLLNKTVNEAVVFRKLAEVIRSLGIHGHAILVGRGSYLITQDLKTSLHVRLVAPRRWRIHRVADDYQLTLQEAEKYVDQGEKERARFLKTFYAQNPDFPFSHDLIIDNSRFNLAQVAEIIFTCLGVRFGETLVGA